MAPDSKIRESLKSVLIVEDDDSIRSALELLLECLGCRYLSAADGKQATAILENTKVDVLITDFQMPHMDGIELLQWCRARNLHFPVIFISANASLIEKERIALQDCCATLMAKPIDLDALTEALHSAIHLIHHPNCVHNAGAGLDIRIRSD